MNKKKISALILSSTIIANVVASAEAVQALENNTDNSTQGQATNSTPTLNGIKVSKQLIDINYSKGVTISPKFIVIHDTDNRSYGANAKANRDYFANHPNAQASAHYTVDQSNIIQVLEDTWKGWHVGDKYNPIVGNSNTIGIELCVNVDNNFNKTLENGIALTKYLMEKYNIPAQNVIRHYDVTGKICPKYMIWDKPQLWDYFKSSIAQGNSGTLPGDEAVINTGEIYNVSSTVNVRKGTSTSTQILTSLKLGDKVDILKEESGWYKIKAKVNNYDLIGYVYKDYVKITGTPTTPETPDTTPSENKKGKVVNISSTLNVRESASSSGKIIGSLKNNDEVEIKKTLNGWYEINYNNKSGFVSSNYIQIINDTTTPVDPKPDDSKPEVEKTIVELIKDRHNIIGISEVSKEQFKQFLKNKNIQYKLSSSIDELVDIAYEESAIEGIRADVLIAQAIHETGYFQYGGVVKPEDNNFAGIGATGNGDERNTFSSVRIGIRAQVQHLKAYATSAVLKQEVVDPRYKYVTKGSAPTLEELAGKWAIPGYDKSKYSSLELAANANATYGQVIYKVIQDVKKEVVTTNPDTKPETPNTTPDTKPVEKQTGKVVNISSNLRVRKGPGSNYEVVGYMLNGETVTVEEKSGTWYKITSSKGIIGYVSSDYISINGSSGNNNGNVDNGQNTTPASYKGKVKNITSYLNVRSGAGTNYGVVGTLTNNQVVDVVSESGEWVKIKFTQNGAAKEGFVNRQYLEKVVSNTQPTTPSTPPASDNSSVNTYKGRIKNITSYLNVRSGAGTNYGILGSLKNGQEVDVINEASGWYKIKFTQNGVSKEGFINSQYLEKVTTGTPGTIISNKSGQVINITSNLNVRKGAGNNYYVVGYLLNNEKVEILATEGNWYKIKYSTATGSKEGYVNKDYIKIIG